MDNICVYVYFIKGDNIKVILKGEIFFNIKRDFIIDVRNLMFFVFYSEE